MIAGLYMQNVELSQLLTNLHWTQNELSRRIDVDKNTVSRWINGERKTPKVVILYLSLLARLKSELE